MQNGIPDTETLTVFPAGREWVDQQWLAQAIFYGVERGFGLQGVALLHVLVFGLTVASWMAGARLFGASARATFLVSLPCLVVAPWSWQLRAQALALPLFVWALWLAADHVRRPSRRILWALPILLVWGNVHGSVLLGAVIVSLAAVWVGVRKRHDRRALLAAVGTALAAWLCSMATPYGLDIVGYYQMMILDPPFGDSISEWQRTKPTAITAFFYGVAILSTALVAWQRRRLTFFEIAVLAMLLVGAFDAVRGIVWFSLAVGMFVPLALDGVLRKPDRVQYPRFNAAFAGAFVAALVVVLGVIAAKPASWFEGRWPEGMIAAVRSAGPDAKVYPSDRHADWLLWRIPELRGRIAYDVRFELFTRDRFIDLVKFDSEYKDQWMHIADGFDVIVVDEQSKPSHTADFLAEPGARAAYRDEDTAVIVRGRQ